MGADRSPLLEPGGVFLHGEAQGDDLRPGLRIIVEDAPVAFHVISGTFLALRPPDFLTPFTAGNYGGGAYLAPFCVAPGQRSDKAARPLEVSNPSERQCSPSALAAAQNRHLW